MTTAVRALLFDLGGVVIDIDFDRMLHHWLPHSRLTLRQMRERLCADEAHCRHERGEIDATAYMAHLAASFALDTDVENVAAGWNAMLVDEIPDTLDLIDRVGTSLPCYAFSNTSAVHHEQWARRFPRVTTVFRRMFLSFELGLRKPERDAFHAVAAAIGEPPRSIVFFDDTEENVHGAREAGLDAVLVEGPLDVRYALTERGIIVPGTAPDSSLRTQG